MLQDLSQRSIETGFWRIWDAVQIYYIRTQSWELCVEYNQSLQFYLDIQCGHFKRKSKRDWSNRWMIRTGTRLDLALIFIFCINTDKWNSSSISQSERSLYSAERTELKESIIYPQIKSSFIVYIGLAMLQTNKNFADFINLFSKIKFC